MKELLLIGTTILALTSGSITVASNTGYSNRPERGNHTSVSMIHKAELKAEAQAKILEQQRLQENSDRVDFAIKKLKKHVNKTWYVFSGATPSGWDCSGLTMWFYQQLEIELEHRASKQDTSGKQVFLPKPGDLVVFHYKGNKDAYHVGIYVGNENMIHSPKHGHLTRIENINSFGGSYSNITYRSLIETL